LRDDGTPKTFIYHYDLQGNLISETREDGKPLRDYIWINTTPIAQIKVRRNKKGVLKQKQLLYLHTDHLNTPRLATDATQTVVWRWEAEAFGATKPDKDPDRDGKKVNIRLRFPGQYQDGESGLYYNWNRYYDPKIGRYVTSDPIGFLGGSNSYAYAFNNPFVWIDGFGLLPTCDFISLGTRRNVFTEQERTLFLVKRTIKLLPGGFTVGPNLDPRIRRRLPIRPTISVELWLVEIRSFLVKEFLVTELFERFKVFCEETRRRPCGEEQTFLFNYETEKLLSRDRKLLRKFIDTEEELLFLLFRFWL